MSSFYNTTKGQLITIWVFGVLLWMYVIVQAISTYSKKEFWEISTIVIPGALIFYVIGRRNYKKKQLEKR